MAYESELSNLVAWVAAHPGQTCAKMKLHIESIPWEAGQSNGSVTRLSVSVPAVASLKWKLRYLELKGDLYQQRGQWFTTDPA